MQFINRIMQIVHGIMQPIGRIIAFAGHLRRTIIPTTRVPQAPSCPPWSGAGAGVGISRGIPRYTIMFRDLKDSKIGSSKNT